MVILEHGQAQARTLLFFPCTAEPVWAFAETIALLSKTWHVFQAVFDGHQPEYPGDFTSVEQAEDEVTAFLKNRGVARLDAAYGCSLGGACLTRILKPIPTGPSAASSGRATIMPFRISLPRAARSLPIGTARKRRKTGRITSAF